MTRSAKEIQDAHDLLIVALGNPDLDNPVFGSHKEARQVAAVALHTLCWALGHEDTDHFAGLLDFVERKLANEGFVLEELDALYATGRKPS